MKPQLFWRTLEADNSGGVSKGLPDECGKLQDEYWKLGWSSIHLIGSGINML
jgi:hypothetical protein